MKRRQTLRSLKILTKPHQSERVHAKLEMLSADYHVTSATFQLWGAGRSKVSTDDTRELKKARKEGRLAEAMLERRSKLKRLALQWSNS